MPSFMASKTPIISQKGGKARYGRFAALGLFGFLVFLACVAFGSVNIPLQTTANLLIKSLLGQELPSGVETTIVLTVRLPRVLSVFLVGASLALCGATMQGLLRNPLADGATLGVSSGASLGAMVAIFLGVSLPNLPLAGTAVLSILFAFLSLSLVLFLAFVLDRSLETGTIILIGVIFTMFSGSLMSLLISFSGTRLRSLTFWMLGSLASSGYQEAGFLLITLLVCGSLLILSSRELDAFAIGEENAANLGVSVKQVKISVMVLVSILIGVCVAIGGSIGFVGLIIPHITRALTGPRHIRLLPLSVFIGGIFLMLCDLLARTLLSPVELPLGVVTSLIGAVFFVVILMKKRRTA